MANIFYAIFKHCKAEDIVFIIDGDDELIGRQAFKLFNAVYQKTNALVAYSNYVAYDKSKQ